MWKHKHRKKGEYMSFKLDIITVDDGEIEQVFGSAGEVLDYLCDNVDPDLIASMLLTESDGKQVKGYYKICEHTAKIVTEKRKSL